MEDIQLFVTEAHTLQHSQFIADDENPLLPAKYYSSLILISSLTWGKY
jgi:hypothetical protein